MIIANLTATSVHGGWEENEGDGMGMEVSGNPIPSEVQFLLLEHCQGNYF